MPNLKNNFDSRLIIADHFDDIINQIDIKTETLFQNNFLSDEIRNELNQIRDEQIEKIKEIKEINLNRLQNEEEEGLEDLMKPIHFDCVLMEPTTTLNGLVLWITSGFYNQQDLEFLK
jgi:hypothetical protein